MLLCTFEKQLYNGHQKLHFSNCGKANLSNLRVQAASLVWEEKPVAGTAIRAEGSLPDSSQRRAALPFGLRGNSSRAVVPLPGSLSKRSVPL